MAFGLAFWPLHLSAETAFDVLVQDFLSKSFATAALLNDDEVVKFGIWDFNPNDFVDVGNEGLGSDESSKLRQSLRQFSLPFRWSLSDDQGPETLALIAKVGYLELDQDSYLLPSSDPEPDRIEEQVFSAGAGVGYSRRLDKHWELLLESYLTWMRYRSKVEFNTSESRSIQPVLDGLLTNIDTETLLVEPAAGVNYSWSSDKTQYQAFTKYHYLRGRAIGASIPAHEARSEAWYWANGISIKNPLRLGGGSHALWLRASRVDMGGDLDGALGENHYYEAGVAWLMDSPGAVSFLDNVGLGININYGSELRGGTLILLYNVDTLDDHRKY